MQNSVFNTNFYKRLIKANIVSAGASTYEIARNTDVTDRISESIEVTIEFVQSRRAISMRDRDYILMQKTPQAQYERLFSVILEKDTWAFLVLVEGLEYSGLEYISRLYSIEGIV